MMKTWRLALFTIVAVASLAGCGSKPAGTSEFTIEVTDAGFVPATVELPQGKPVTLVVTRKTDETCATEMVFEKTGVKYDLPLNQTVRIDLPASDPDTLRYACAMNMIKGQLVVK